MPHKNIYLVRHSEVYNPNKLCYGQSEMPLEENFTVAFDWVKDKLNLHPEAAVYSSPLRRCTKLANYLGDGDFLTNELISDVDFGTWEMKEWSGIPKKELQNWQKDFVHYKVKNGESFIDVYDRSVEFFEDMLDQSDDENLVIITHSGVIRSIVAYILDFPLENVFNLQIDNSSISKITCDKASGVCSIAFLNLTTDNSKLSFKD